MTMSIKSVAYHSISVANNQLGGAYTSKSARTRHGRAFLNFCHFRGNSLVDIKHTTFELLRDWVTSLKDANLSKGTINNHVASIRALCSQRGANLESLGLTDTSGLGVDVRNRKCTKLPVTDEIFEAAIVQAIAANEIGFVHALKLERYLGLRGTEAMMSTVALKTYAKQAHILMQRHLSPIHIVDGTKGGRPRDIAVIEQYASETFQAITEALAFSLQNNGFLIVGKAGTGLKGARSKYHRLAAKFGLTGVYAPHSLRYRYCIDKLLELNAAGVPRNEALAFASECLGHGASRTRFVSMVYGRSVTHLLQKTTRKQNIQQVMAELTELAGYSIDAVNVDRQPPRSTS
jgi:Integrase